VEGREYRDGERVVGLCIVAQPEQLLHATSRLDDLRLHAQKLLHWGRPRRACGSDGMFKKLTLRGVIR
jgi:hypothetical protein